MKGVSAIVILILLILISISLAGSLHVWSSNVVFESYPGEDITRAYQRTRACLSLENIDGAAGTATIRNCGLIPLSDILLYIDNSEVSFSYPDKLDPNEELVVTFSPLAPGEHSYFAVTDLSETPLITASNS